MTEADLQLYETRGDLLETKAIAEKKARPFYLQPQLDEVNEQIHAVEQAYQIKQPTEAEAVQAEVANDDNWLESSIDAQPDPIVKMFKRIANPYLVGSVRKPTDKTVDVSEYFNGYKARASKTWAERHLNNGGG